MQFSPTHTGAPGRQGRSIVLWAVRRALLALVLLTLFIAGIVALLYASIDPDDGASASTSATSAQAKPRATGEQD